MRFTSASATLLALVLAGIVGACSGSAAHEAASSDAGVAPSPGVDASMAPVDAGPSPVDAAEDAPHDSSLPIEDSGAVCVNEAPASCPDAAPSFTSDVLPILQVHCYECHSDAGVNLSGSGIDLGSYEGVYHERGAILSQLSECKMPPLTAPDGMAPPLQPTPGDRATVLGWIRCGSLDN